ncbi:purine-nucleoside phosphorylase [Dyadobacter psychrotolerans]|uniref:Purine nucleoside phosphorylase n=1 Tax=Dyadobacter psychrotolerans TaxID=2541721 RepID=A0A4R5DZ82_9BACT|nr:purine-nucleoside phosphorylase [Dyadobacter psychrotolerans]TDE17481.1 purine-nucleoside phosphorylase [Dyadobacter psychrotolerans]
MLLEQIQKASEFLKEYTKSFEPEFGIILGTGLGSLVNEIEITYTISYSDIPNFPVSTVESHSGKLIFGNLSGKKVLCMQGRFHYYEGYSMQQVVFPVRVMKLLGVQTLLVSNACGSLNPAYKISDLMVINDHISSFLPLNPLIGTHIPEFGDRFPDMSDPYDAVLIQRALNIADENHIPVHSGVYVSVSGPQLETRAEYRMLRQIGGDVVGMSTVPEIIAARQMGIRCFGLSVITDLGIPETLEKAEFSKIVAAAQKAEPGMTLIMKELLTYL